MPRYRGTPKVLHNDILITISEAAEILSVSPSCCRAMYIRGHQTMNDMVEYRKKLSKAKNKTYNGVKQKKHLTSRGNLTVNECFALHEYGLNKNAINYRGRVWGWDHKGLWLPKLPNGEFKKAAIKVDGPPRGDGKYSTKYIKKKDRKKRFNRTKTCFMSKGTIRCKHYKKRLLLYQGEPKICKQAEDSSCPNFSGESITPGRSNDIKPVRQYLPNGTYV